MNERDDPLLTPKEAAKDLKKSVSFLAKARMNGTGPEFIKLGRSVLYRRSALEAYKDTRTRISTSQYSEARLQPRRGPVVPKRPTKRLPKQ
jgi:hypothetical protein